MSLIFFLGTFDLGGGWVVRPRIASGVASAEGLGSLGNNRLRHAVLKQLQRRTWSAGHESNPPAVWVHGIDDEHLVQASVALGAASQTDQWSDLDGHR
jgi:hypothetical protein